jgi:hypothetical protein
MNNTVATPRRIPSIILAGVTVALPLLLAAIAPAEIVLPLAIALPFGTMIWLEGARPRVAPSGRVSVA